MILDILTVGVAFFSFGIFLLVHLVTFRWVRPEHLLKSLLAGVIAMLGLPLVLTGILYFFKATDASLLVWVSAAILSSLIQGLLCFVYVLCIFGPYETSVRMRLVREMAGAPQGMTMYELLQRYNEEIIVDLRLCRLLGSGDLIEKEGRYQMAGRKNFFFIFDAMAGFIKKWIGR